MIRILLLGVCLWIVSCSSPTIEQPEPFIEEDKMVAILFDFSILNAVSNTQNAYLKERDIAPMTIIYNWHGIDSLTFSKNDIYYASKPKQYLKIYQRVNDSLESLKEGYDEAVRVALLKRKDSMERLSSKKVIPKLN